MRPDMPTRSRGIRCSPNRRTPRSAPSGTSNARPAGHPFLRGQETSPSSGSTASRTRASNHSSGPHRTRTHCSPRPPRKHPDFNPVPTRIEGPSAGSFLKVTIATSSVTAVHVGRSSLDRRDSPEIAMPYSSPKKYPEVPGGASDEAAGTGAGLGARPSAARCWSPSRFNRSR